MELKENIIFIIKLNYLNFQESDILLESNFEAVIFHDKNSINKKKKNYKFSIEPSSSN